MKTYVGLDVSLEKTSVCIVDESAAVLKEAIVASKPDAIF